jgi:hypothetical protein
LAHGHDPDLGCRRKLLLGPFKERARSAALSRCDHGRGLSTEVIKITRISEYRLIEGGSTLIVIYDYFRHI